MQTVIVNRRRLFPPVLTALLPSRILGEAEATVPEAALPEELRIGRERCALLVAGGKNLRLSPATALTAEECEGLLLRFCDGALYAHEETLCEGFLTLAGGIRVGVAGHAAVQGGRISGVRDVTSFVLRIPHETPPVGEEICDLLRVLSGRGVLIFAPPGVGKTTLLRAVAEKWRGAFPPAAWFWWTPARSWRHSPSARRKARIFCSATPRGRAFPLPCAPFRRS